VKTKSACSADGIALPDGGASQLRYRPDIDGLRAIAILPVVLYHAGFPSLKGGFVGVDVFFVISGFLMASLILGEIERGTFTLAHFYERRIRRIFPALFAVIAASAVAAWILFMPIEFQYFSRSAIAAALFGSNILFWQESGYFDTAAQLKPLLHTWSLAVEEQFYIVFPLLLILLTRLGRRYLTWTLGGLLAVSFGLSVWQTEHSPIAGFYLLPSRFWELLLGALLALGLLPRPKSPTQAQMYLLLGILLIGYAVASYGGETNFPGFAALVPCLGAALIIHSNAGNTPVGRLLSAPPLIFIGLISYSLYLWHWPLFVFTRYVVGGNLSLTEAGFVVFASLVLAALSWHFIERPFRGRSSPIGRKALFGAATTAVSATVVFGAFVSIERGLPDRLSAAAELIYMASYDMGRFANQNCSINVDGGGPSLSDVRSGKLCGMGITGSDPSFLVWGDSHAGAMAPAIDLAALRSHEYGLFTGRGSCPPLLDFDFGEAKRLRTNQCRKYNAAVLNLIARRRIPVVFMVALWPKYVHRGEPSNEGIYFDPSRPIPLDDWSVPFAQSLDHTLQEINRLGARVVLVMDVPEIGYNVPEALAKAVTAGVPADIAPSWTSVLKRQSLARTVLESYGTKYGVTVIDPLRALCDDKRCYVERNGIVLYHDADHLTATGARSISSIYDSVFNGTEQAEAAFHAQHDEWEGSALGSDHPYPSGLQNHTPPS
jgi:peptidoglycan/LPS O-acetylase OafA/YrhL